ncbi:MAG: hypothetical protein JSW23_07720 [Planctomycetota bacterium]|nr:MAG: hypothetical protein JSW23_07720 [Planctomycetota bacterium]
MASRERLILVFVLLFAGLLLIGCGLSYPYSELENQVFAEVNKLSRSIPKGFVRDDNMYANQDSKAISKGQLILIHCEAEAEYGLFATRYNIDDDVARRLREMEKYEHIDIYELDEFLFTLSDDLVIFVFIGRGVSTGC